MFSSKNISATFRRSLAGAGNIGSFLHRRGVHVRIAIVATTLAPGFRSALGGRGLRDRFLGGVDVVLAAARDRGALRGRDVTLATVLNCFRSEENLTIVSKKIMEKYCFASTLLAGASVLFASGQSGGRLGDDARGRFGLDLILI